MALSTGSYQAWRQFCNVVFGGRYLPFPRGPNRPAFTTKASVPNGEDAPLGTLVWDSTNSDGYICTVITGTYVKMNA